MFWLLLRKLKCCFFCLLEQYFDCFWETQVFVYLSSFYLFEPHFDCFWENSIVCVSLSFLLFFFSICPFFCLFVYLSHILIASERTPSVCRSWRWLRGRRERSGGGAFNFLFNLPPTLIPPLLYFGIIFGFAPSLIFANAVLVTILFWGNCPDCLSVCEARLWGWSVFEVVFQEVCTWSQLLSVGRLFKQLSIIIIIW